MTSSLLVRNCTSQAFKNYDESGSPKKINCLKYLVLANMLMKSDVDPFDAQEVAVLRPFALFQVV